MNEEVKQAVSDFLVELKNEGLELSEDVLQLLLDKVFALIIKLVQESDNVYDDILIPLLPLIKAEISKLIDKLDGKEG